MRKEKFGQRVCCPTPRGETSPHRPNCASRGETGARRATLHVRACKCRIRPIYDPATSYTTKLEDGRPDQRCVLLSAAWAQVVAALEAAPSPIDVGGTAPQMARYLEWYDGPRAMMIERMRG